MFLADEMVFCEWERVAFQNEKHCQIVLQTDWKTERVAAGIEKGRSLFASPREMQVLCPSDEVSEQWKVGLQMVGKGMMELVVDGVVLMIILIQISRPESRPQFPSHLCLFLLPLSHLLSVQHPVVLTTPKLNTEHSTAQQTP
jgi:hypothetical protein